MFHTVFLGSRAIGGSEEWGYSDMGKIVGQEDKLFPFQIWFIWREDRLWRVEIRGFEGASIIPGISSSPGRAITSVTSFATDPATGRRSGSPMPPGN